MRRVLARLSRVVTTSTQAPDYSSINEEVELEMERQLRRRERRMGLKDSEELLRTAPVGRLGMSWKNKPYVVPLTFVYNDGRIYLHSAKRGKKMVSVAKNPRVCFEVDQLIRIKTSDSPCSFSAYYRSVIVSGKAKRIKTAHKKAQILRKLTEKYAGKTIDSVFDKDELEKVEVVEIIPRRITGKQNLPPDKQHARAP